MENTELISIGKKIKKYRRLADLTQKNLADISGVSKNFISAIENGTKTMSIQSMLKIADALNVSPKILLESNQEREERERIINLLKYVDSLPEEDKKFIYKLLDAILNNMQS